jgi:hypothetical protein
MPMRPLDDETRREFALIDELRTARGATEDFARIVLWHGTDPDEIEGMSENDGITGVIVSPWPMYSDLTVTEKHQAAEKFAAATNRV